MDNLQYSVITNTSREVRARWTGRTIELVVFGANMITDVTVEWHSSVDTAAARFQWLIEYNSKKVVNKRTIVQGAFK